MERKSDFEKILKKRMTKKTRMPQPHLNLSRAENLVIFKGVCIITIKLYRVNCKYRCGAHDHLRVSQGAYIMQGNLP